MMSSRDRKLQVLTILALSSYITLHSRVIRKDSKLVVFYPWVAFEWSTGGNRSSCNMAAM
jgi:hypothetical protein